ncbi:S1C family serine protease [Acidisphaera sp. L21]|uniref:S1C family serine protease n=1 Tax=Acidisphaera sp. L21 TaxID=1641851 RepID=UPI0020B1137D|nr:trypsin-like peptidase domain-containing protein [Acidisphaera sp. L21]
MIRPLVLAAAMMVSGCNVSNAQSGGALLRGTLPSLSPLVKRVVPSVVNIAVTENVGGDSQLPPALRGTPLEKQFRDRLRTRRDQVQGAGSGFVIDSSGVIVTNNHVVGHADKIIVSLSDGTELPAKVIGTDELTDIAVIKVDGAPSLPAVTWGDSSKVEVGDWIIAAGNPFGLGSSVSAGIVSARGRDIGAGPFDDFLQIDAPINPGNSGGPTFNLDGQVIAVNTAIVSPTGGSVGIGFAIPSDIARKIVAELREKGHIDRGWLGVAVQDAPATPGVARTRPTGVIIASVDRNGPAAKSGLAAGDIVTAVNGAAVETAHELIKAVSATTPGTALKLTVKRRNQVSDLTVTVGRRPNEGNG